MTIKESPEPHTYTSNTGLDEIQDGGSDAQLLNEAKEGSVKSAERLLKRYEKRMFSMLWGMLKDWNQARDALQEALLKAFKSLPIHDAARPFGPWIMQIAYNKGIDALRRKGRHPAASIDETLQEDGEGEYEYSLADLLASREVTPPEKLIQLETSHTMRMLVRELPDIYQTAVSLVYLEGRSREEVSDELGIPVGTVRSRLHKALQLLIEMEELGQALA